MSARLAITLALVALIAGLRVETAMAQADVHARALARASCLTGQQSEAVLSARAAMDREPDELPPRMRLADALVDQGCYQEAVNVLEIAKELHPRSGELTAKLRNMRSLVTEQTYIEGLTQAAEGAKFQRNQLRCTKLEDVAACEEALKSKPDDVQLLAAKRDALAKQSALAASERAQGAAAQQTASPLAAGHPATAQAGRANADTAPTSDAPRPKPKRIPMTVAGTPGIPATATPATNVVAAIEPPSEPKTYSNDAPEGRSN